MPGARNYVGAVFGGAMFETIDGVHMVMLIKVLGPDYAVWDKAATIHYTRPGRTMLYARVVLEEQELESIRGRAARTTEAESPLSRCLDGRHGQRVRVGRENDSRPKEGPPTRCVFELCPSRPW